MRLRKCITTHTWSVKYPCLSQQKTSLFHTELLALQSSPRVTHVMRKTENEVKRLQYAGFYSDIDLETQRGFG
jgi:hypothetical protein